MIAALLVTLSIWCAIVLFLRVKYGMMALDHIVGFTLGLAGYWLLPAIIGSFSLFESDTSVFLTLWRDRFDQLGPWPIERYLLVCLCYLASFLLGSVRFTHPRLQQCSAIVPLHCGPGKWVLRCIITLIAASGAYFVFTLRDSLFRGYTEDTFSNFGFRGSLTAVVAALFTLFLLEFDAVRNVGTKSWRYSAGMTAVFCLALLSLGSRLMVMQSIMAMGVYWTVFRTPFKVWKILAVAVCLWTGSTILGVWRVGDATSIDEIISRSAYEYIGSSHSLVEFLRTERFDLLNAPTPLLDDLKNLAPTVLVGEKDTDHTSLELQGYDAYIPFGALNNYLSLMGNFGVIGSCVFLFVCSWALERLRLGQSTLARVQYSIVCAMLPMSFFRDPFRVSLVKGVLQNAVLLPWAVIAIATLAVVLWESANSKRMVLQDMRVSSSLPY